MNENRPEGSRTRVAAVGLALLLASAGVAAAQAPVAPPTAGSPETGQTATGQPAAERPAATQPAASEPAPASPSETAPVVPVSPPAAAPAPAASSPAPAGAPQETLSPEAPGGIDGETLGGVAPDADAGTLPHDLSPWGMFLAADYVVKAVMLGLAFASLVTWTIWLAKALELMTAKRRARWGVRRLETTEGLPTAGGLEDAGWRGGPVAALVRAAVDERDKSADLPNDGVKERVAVALSRIEARAGRRMSRGTGLLATIGSTAPFVGLFGTVWGIMNAFIGISQANTTNLAVVAPGIAEALLATAIGLVAAIPAVIIYNVFARAIAGYKAVLSDASAGVLRHLSRDLDRARAARPMPRAALHAAE